MAILFLVLFIPLLIVSWYGIGFLAKKILNSKYNKKYSKISFVVAIPILFLIFVYILLALAIASGEEFP